MNKPVKMQILSLNYHECRDYLQEKFNYNERDFAARFQESQGIQPDTHHPYQDFWHFVLDRADYITNSCTFEMHKEWIDGFEEDDFRAVILNHYFDEFGDGEESIQFYVEW